MKNTTKYRSGMCTRTRFLSVPGKFTVSKTDDERVHDSNMQRLRGTRSVEMGSSVYRGTDKEGHPFVSNSMSLDSSVFLKVPSEKDCTRSSKLRSQSDSDVIDVEPQTTSSRSRKKNIAAVFFGRKKIGGRRCSVSCTNTNSAKRDNFIIHVPKPSGDVFYPQHPVVK